MLASGFHGELVSGGGFMRTQCGLQVGVGSTQEEVLRLDASGGAEGSGYLTLRPHESRHQGWDALRSIIPDETSSRLSCWGVVPDKSHYSR